MEDIENNLDLAWSFYYISRNPNLSEALGTSIRPELAVIINFVKKYIDKLDWYYVSLNKNMTLDIIESNPDLLWDYECISSNPNLSEALGTDCRP